MTSEKPFKNLKKTLLWQRRREYILLLFSLRSLVWSCSKSWHLLSQVIS